MSTQGKIRQLHTLFSSIGKTDRQEKLEWLSEALDKKVKSSKELSNEELDLVILDLQSKQDPSITKMKRKILSLCHLHNWTVWDAKQAKLKADTQRLDEWLMSDKSRHQKPLNSLNYTELINTVTQFERMVRKTLS